MSWYVTYPTPLPLPQGCVAVLGTFDGVHQGHQALMAKATGLAQAANLPLVALTFWPHPRVVLQPDVPLKVLHTLPEKVAALQAAGAEGVAVVPFTRDLATLSPADFVQVFLQEWLQVKAVAVGENFRFGAQAKGNAMLLQANPAFKTYAVPLVGDAQGPYSSTRLRAAQS
jgi:riboflavin kinase / FMN adenylyltransferase